MYGIFFFRQNETLNKQTNEKICHGDSYLTIASLQREKSYQYIHFHYLDLSLKNSWICSLMKRESKHSYSTIWIFKNLAKWSHGESHFDGVLLAHWRLNIITFFIAAAEVHHIFLAWEKMKWYSLFYASISELNGQKANEILHVFFRLLSAVIPFDNRL